MQRVEQGLRDVASPLPSLVSSIRHSKMYQFCFKRASWKKAFVFPPVQFKHKCRRKKRLQRQFCFGKKSLTVANCAAFAIPGRIRSGCLFLFIPDSPQAPIRTVPLEARTCTPNGFATRLRCHCRLPMKEATVICSFWKRSLFNDGAPGWQRKRWVCSTWRWERLPLNTYSTATGTRKAFSFNIHT